MGLYESPLGLFDFQAMGVAQCYARADNLVVWETGLGKSHNAMATAALLFEDGLIDHTIIVCEKNKVAEWKADFQTFTSMDVGLYYGSPAKRSEFRDDLPQVFVSTYETMKVDIAQAGPRKSSPMTPHLLAHTLEGKRVLVVYDEATKLGNRTSGNHKAHLAFIQHLRATGECRTMFLTATPIERSPENLYNLGRILLPNHIGTVAQFDRDHVAARDIFGNASKFKNLNPDKVEAGVVPFSQRFDSVMIRKRKTDPDVIEQFPSTVEEFTYIDLSPSQKDFYFSVRDALDDGKEMTDRLLFGLMRQIAAHPMSLIHSQGQMAQQVVEAVGVEALQQIGSTKQDRLIEYLTPLVLGQGAQVVVFTFFGPSVIPYLAEAMREADITVAINHGQMGDSAREAAKASFKAGGAQVFLTSDAGARGINLPEATYVCEFEMALTHANRTQRLNRIHRIDSDHPSVTFQSFIARNTIEEGIAQLVLKRNKWSDQLLDDDDPGDGFFTAEMRRQMIHDARAKKG